MAGFENYARDTAEIEAEIARKGVALGIDWSDEVEVRLLAQEALDFKSVGAHVSVRAELDYQQLARIELFGLAGLMLKTMAESATHGLETHGGPVWKIFSRALWAEAEARGLIK
jgi:hypothetical protein